MKTIGLLGGVGWTSTVAYYTKLNQLVHERLGGYHSAKIVLHSIDYHEIMSSYGQDPLRIQRSLERELQTLFSYAPDGVIICCNSLHKYYDVLQGSLSSNVPIFHGGKLTAEYLNLNRLNNVLLLATQATLEDGFFERILNASGIRVTIPEHKERIRITEIHNELMQGKVTPHGKEFFSNLVAEHDNLDAVVVGCSEFPMVLSPETSKLKMVDPIELQVEAAVNFALI